MYAAVLRPCPGREMFMLSVFEAAGSASPWISARHCCVGLPQGGTFAFARLESLGGACGVRLAVLASCCPCCRSE